jgi:hypothetical protein
MVQKHLTKKRDDGETHQANAKSCNCKTCRKIFKPTALASTGGEIFQAKKVEVLV